MTDRGALARLDVSRETTDRLQALEALLKKWNPAINLVAKSTIEQAWSRHILDSVQVYAAGPETAAHWADLGSGGGFPGLVIAALAAERDPQRRITLVESDQRKAAFLREAARQLDLTITVLAERVETTAPLAANILSARALAGLSELCGFAARHLVADGTALFPKGATHMDELAAARARWVFDVTIHPSETDPASVILELKGIQHV